MKKQSTLESVLGRLDDLDSVSLVILVKRFARERKLLETIFTTIREGIIVVERGGVVQYANPAALSLLGLQTREIGRVNLWKNVPDLARSLPLKKGQLDGEAGMSREVELNYPEHRLVRLYLMPMADPDLAEEGPTRSFAVIITDITAEKASTKEEIESEKINSILHLAAGVAHELGNPLNSLNIQLQLLKRQVAKQKDRAAGEKLNQTVDVCVQEIQRLDAIVQNFLEAVRPKPPDLVNADLLLLLEQTLELIGPELKDAGVDVDIQSTTDLPTVMADKNQVKQVFFNILKNAREAMAHGGTIRIRARADDDFVFIQIADSGEGISEENLSRIFLPYFTTKDTGTGLGMMIVQRIMRSHGGQIGIDSRPGVGTIVTLQFSQKHRRVRLLK